MAIEPVDGRGPAELPRRFGVWTGLFAVVAAMIGVGILTASGYTILATESYPTFLLVYVLAGLLALAGALTLAELATALPLVGGDYIYVRDAFGQPAAFMYGWATLLVGFAGPTALIAHAAVEYLLVPVAAGRQEPLPAVLTPLLASALVITFSVMHSIGQTSSAWAQNGSTILKVASLLLFVSLGIAFGQGDWTHLTIGRPLLEQRAVDVTTALIYATYAYAGWNGAVYLAGEMREPARLLPRCLIGGTLLVMVIYLLLILLYAYAIPPAALHGVPAKQVEAVADTAAQRLFGPAVSVPFSFVIGLGILASVSAYLLAGPRMVFAMAKDGLFPTFAGRVDPRFQTPLLATVVQAVLTLVVLWSAETFEALLQYTSVGLAALSTLSVGSIFRLRGRPDYQASYRVPLYPLPPLLFVTATWAAVAFMIVGNPGPSLLSLASMALGYPAFYLCRRFRLTART